jgi:hypothetical protein
VLNSELTSSVVGKRFSAALTRPTLDLPYSHSNTEGVKFTEFSASSNQNSSSVRSNMAQSEPDSHSTYWSIHVVRAKAGTIAMARPEKTRLCGRYPGNDT